jgi:hypothetical protein
MAQLAQVDRREIHFYTEALPQLEVCAFSCFLLPFHVDVRLPMYSVCRNGQNLGKLILN